MTMTLVSTVTVGLGGAASIDFTSIPQTGTDLLLLVSVRRTNAQTWGDLLLRINSDSGSNYTYCRLYGDGSAAGSDTTTTTGIYAEQPGANATANTFGNVAYYLPNYTNGNAKIASVDYVTEGNISAMELGITANRWTGTNAITSLSLINNFAQYSTASLYTITKGSGGATVS